MHTFEVPQERSRNSPKAIRLSQSAIAQWLLHCVDPLGPKSRRPDLHLSSQQVRKLMLKADAHKVLPAILRNFPASTGDPALERIWVEAQERKVEAAALTTMLSYHANAILEAARELPVALVKGPLFARLYPLGLRPFGDIDILVPPAALPELATILLAQGFIRLTGHDPSLLEDSWVHRENRVLTVEVHTNLVHSRRMRAAFSLTYEHVAGSTESPGTLLAVAVLHGAMHYFAWLRHVVDICQAARALTSATEESHFESLVDRTGTRMAAIIGLTLAHRLLGEERCIEVARALGSPRNFYFARPLIEGAVVTATMESAIVYNFWRRFIFSELMRQGTLFSCEKGRR